MSHVCARAALRWEHRKLNVVAALIIFFLLNTTGHSAQCNTSGDGKCAQPEAWISILSPLEGGTLDISTGAIEIDARGAYAKVALYLDGSFVSITPLSPRDGRERIPLPLPGSTEACGGWHFVEVALMDADDWRLETPEAEAAVRFILGCEQHDARFIADAKKAAAERKERERAQVFEGIYENFGWEPSADGSKESRSGPGSYLKRTGASRAFLSDVIREYNLTTMLAL